MRPEYDVIVVGAGPAGIAAAVRARWVKRYLAVPCKVAMVDPAILGGLTTLGTTNIIGPGWIYSAESFRPHLTRDVARFSIPHVRQRAMSVRRGKEFQVELADGSSLSSRSVVLCSGMRLLSDEARFWKRGLSATSLGIEPSVRKIVGWLSDTHISRIVFVGSIKIFNLTELVSSVWDGRTRVTFVIEPTIGYKTGDFARGMHCPGIDFEFGTVVQLHGDDHLRTIVIEGEDGRRRAIHDVDLVILDFISFETTPARSFRCEGLILDCEGFVSVDRRQRTNIDGLFAAGDVTGMPSAVAPAIAEGIVAGFEAYRYVHRRKFNAEPKLFAYYGFDFPIERDSQELPSYSPQNYGPEILSDIEYVRRLTSRRFSGRDRDLALSMLHLMERHYGTVLSISELATLLSSPVQQIQVIVERFLRFKQITLQPV